MLRVSKSAILKNGDTENGLVLNMACKLNGPFISLVRETTKSIIVVFIKNKKGTFPCSYIHQKKKVGKNKE